MEPSQALGPKLAFVEGVPDRASRLPVVRAVAESATVRQGVDVLEAVLDALRRVPQLKLAHPRSVDDDPSAGKKHHLSMRGGVASLVIIFSGLLHGKEIRAGQLVHEGGLAHTG